MSREEVELHQERRILEAMRELIATQGYEQTTVTQVVERAGVSRKTFYDLRGGRDRWFLEICDAAGGRLLRRLALATTAAPGDSLDLTIATALIDFCLDDPDTTRVCFTETLAANMEARAWRETLIERAAGMIADALALQETNSPPVSDLAARAALGVALELTSRHPASLDRQQAVSVVVSVLAETATVATR